MHIRSIIELRWLGEVEQKYDGHVTLVLNHVEESVARYYFTFSITNTTEGAEEFEILFFSPGNKNAKQEEKSFVRIDSMILLEKPDSLSEAEEILYRTTFMGIWSIFGDKNLDIYNDINTITLSGECHPDFNLAAYTLINHQPSMQMEGDRSVQNNTKPYLQ